EVLRRRIALPRLNQAPAIFWRGRPNLGPFVFGQGLQRHRKKDVLFFEDHLFDCAERRQDSGGGEMLAVGNGGRAFVGRSVHAFQGRTDVVVFCPHHLRWTGDAMLFEEREKGVLLALIVLVYIHQFVCVLLDLQKLRSAFLVVWTRREFAKNHASLGNDRLDGSILAAKRIDRVAGSNRGGGKLYQNFAGDLRMKVTHRVYFLDWHASGNQLLFHRHDLGGIGLSHYLTQLGLYRFWSLPLVKMLNDFFEGGDFAGAIVNKFAHIAPQERVGAAARGYDDFCHGERCRLKAPSPARRNGRGSKSCRRHWRRKNPISEMDLRFKIRRSQPGLGRANG